MLISPRKLRHELSLSPDDRTIGLALLGMPNLGKSHWSQKLGEKYGYPVHAVDEMTAARPELAGKIAGLPGKNNVEKLGHYLGLPYAEGYAEREREFLAAERAVLRALAWRSGVADMTGDVLYYVKPPGIIDLSGSAIYHPDEMAAIKQTHLIVFLDADDGHLFGLFEQYKAEPSPVCYNGGYISKPGEPNHLALARNYLELLASRGRLYAEQADVTLPYAEHKACQTAEDFTIRLEIGLARDDRVFDIRRFNQSIDVG